MVRKLVSAVYRPVTALLVLLALIIPAGQAVAATATTGAAGGNGLRVSPVRTDVTVAAGQTQVVYITVTNVTGGAANFQAIFNDFVANPDESGNPAIILDPTKFAPSHSLKRYVAPISDFSLQAGQEKSIPVSITVPANAAGGGYYGAVRFAPASLNGESGKQVNLSGSVGSLILAKVPGDIHEQVSVAGIDVRAKQHVSSFFFSDKNLVTDIRLQNEGNIQEAPFGKILVRTRTNKTIGEYELNNIDPPGNVLPDSIRKFTVPIKSGSFGEYKVEGNFGYGSAGQLISVSTTFYVVPLTLIIAFIAIVVILASLIFGLPKLIRAYNRRVLRRAGRR